jgi:hypothetical protein
MGVKIAMNRSFMSVGKKGGGVATSPTRHWRDPEGRKEV